MPIPTFTGMGPNPSFDDVTKKLNTLVMELRNLMLGLDTLNIIELNASVITALSITADKIKAGEITADKMNVSELSAIAANLGTITAGIINAVTINSATISIQDDVTIGNNLTVGFGSNDRQIALGGAILSFITSVHTINSCSSCEIVTCCLAAAGNNLMVKKKVKSIITGVLLFIFIVMLFILTSLYLRKIKCTAV